MFVGVKENGSGGATALEHTSGRNGGTREAAETWLFLVVREQWQGSVLCTQGCSGEGPLHVRGGAVAAGGQALIGRKRQRRSWQSSGDAGLS